MNISAKEDLTEVWLATWYLDSAGRHARFLIMHEYISKGRPRGLVTLILIMVS